MKQRDYISLTSGRMVLLLLFIINNIICVMHSYPLTNPDYCKMKLPTVLTELGTKMMVVVVINMVSPNSEWGSAAAAHNPPTTHPRPELIGFPRQCEATLLCLLPLRQTWWSTCQWKCCGRSVGRPAATTHTTMLENSLDWSRQNSGRFFSFFGKLELRERKKKEFC